MCPYDLGRDQTSVDLAMCVPRLIPKFILGSTFQRFYLGKKGSHSSCPPLHMADGAVGPSPYACFSVVCFTFTLCCYFHSHTNSNYDSYAVQVLGISSPSCCP